MDGWVMDGWWWITDDDGWMDSLVSGGWMDDGWWGMDGGWGMGGDGWMDRFTSDLITTWEKEEFTGGSHRPD